MSSVSSVSSGNADNTLISPDEAKNLAFFVEMLIAGALPNSRFQELAMNLVGIFMRTLEAEAKKEWAQLCEESVHYKQLLKSGILRPLEELELEKQKELLKLQESMKGVVPCIDLHGRSLTITKEELCFDRAINWTYERQTTWHHSKYIVSPANPHSHLKKGTICGIHVHGKWVVAVFLAQSRLNGKQTNVFAIRDDKTLEVVGEEFRLFAKILVNRKSRDSTAVSSIRMHLLAFILHTMGATFFNHPEEVEKHYYCK